MKLKLMDYSIMMDYSIIINVLSRSMSRKDGLIALEGFKKAGLLDISKLLELFEIKRSMTNDEIRFWIVECTIGRRIKLAAFAHFRAQEKDLRNQHYPKLTKTNQNNHQ